MKSQSLFSHIARVIHRRASGGNAGKIRKGDAEVAIGFFMDEPDVVTDRFLPPQSKAGLPLDITQSADRNVALGMSYRPSSRALGMLELYMASLSGHLAPASFR
jgi:hypothetical protein